MNDNQDFLKNVYNKLESLIYSTESSQYSLGNAIQEFIFNYLLMRLEIQKKLNVTEAFLTRLFLTIFFVFGGLLFKSKFYITVGISFLISHFYRSYFGHLERQLTIAEFLLINIIIYAILYKSFSLWQLFLCTGYFMLYRLADLYYRKYQQRTRPRQTRK